MQYITRQLSIHPAVGPIISNQADVNGRQKEMIQADAVGRYKTPAPRFRSINQDAQGRCPQTVADDANRQRHIGRCQRTQGGNGTGRCGGPIQRAGGQFHRRQAGKVWKKRPAVLD